MPKVDESECSGDCLRLNLRLHGAFALPNIELTGVIDPYAIVRVAGLKQRTPTILTTTSPEWNASMVFPFVASIDAPIIVNVDIWDDNYLGDKMICSVEFELLGMGQESSASVQQELMTVQLKTPSNGDGGVLRYSAKLTSFKRLERDIEAFEVLARVPLLVFVTKCALRIVDEAVDLKGFVLEHLHPRSLMQLSFSLCMSPYKYAYRLSRSALKKLVAVVV